MPWVPTLVNLFEDHATNLSIVNSWKPCLPIGLLCRRLLQIRFVASPVLFIVAVNGVGDPSATFCYLDTLQLMFGGILVPEITVIPTLGSLLKLEQVLAVLL
mgnify:CR=1 FL=1